MNNIKATQALNEMEISSGLVGDKSWHAQYKARASPPRRTPPRGLHAAPRRTRRTSTWAGCPST